MSASPQPELYPDRSFWLTLVGVFKCVGALGALGLGALGLLGVLMANVMGQNLGVEVAVQTGLLYGGIAAALAALGIGALQARPWARALTLTSSVILIISGIFGTVNILVMLPSTLQQHTAQLAEQSPDVPLEALQIGAVLGMVGGAGLLLVFLVVIPAALIAFYTRPSVVATIRNRTPDGDWSDHCPLPVLALSQLLLFSGLGYLAIALGYNGVVPCFGHYIHGAPGVVINLLLMVLMSVLAVGIYRIALWAWAGTLAIWFLVGLSTAVTYATVGFMSIYDHMNISPVQLEHIQNAPIEYYGWYSIIWLVLAIGYVLVLGPMFFFTKRHPTPG